ncbi:MAG: hypothetical protein AAB445_03385 [Patescibacteria group bacterium]
MRVVFTITLIGAVLNGKLWDELTIQWEELHKSRFPLEVSLQWAATREYALAIIPGLTRLEDAHLEIDVA